MIKKAVLSLFLCLGMATGALAADSGFYVGLKFLDSIQSSGNFSTGGQIADLADASDYTQNTIGGGIFLGYDFYTLNQIPLRAEIEYDLRTDARTEWDAKTNNFYGINISDYNMKVEWNIQTAFFNLYWDFHNDSDFTPYVGAGAGLGIVYNKYKVESPYGDWSKSDYQTVFAWNVGAGCSYAITDSLSADLAYRFIGLGYSETEATVFNQTQKIGMAPYINEFSLGLRYTF